MALLTPSFLPSQTYPFGPSASKVGLRFIFEQLGLQEGAVDTPAFRASQRAAGGANMSLDFAAGGAWVRGDDTARQGFYHAYNDAILNVAVPPNASGSPRFDQAILRAYDSSIAGGTDGIAVEVLAGAPNGSTNIDNRLGAVALPNGAMRLAEWVTPNGAAAITDALLRDRRTYADGARFRFDRTAGDYTTASLSMAALDAVNMAARFECSGRPIEMVLVGDVFISAAAASVLFEPRVDGAALSPGAYRARKFQDVSTNIADDGVLLSVEFTPAAGTHLLAPFWAVGGAYTATLKGDTTLSSQLRIREQPAASRYNGL